MNKYIIIIILVAVVITVTKIKGNENSKALSFQEEQAKMVFDLGNLTKGELLDRVSGSPIFIGSERMNPYEVRITYHCGGNNVLMLNPDTHEPICVRE